MNIVLFLFIIFALQFFCLWVAKKTTANLKTNEDYFLASRSIGFFPLLMTFVATQVGGGLVLGSAEEAAKYGYIVLLYPMGAALGLVVLSLGIGKRLASFKVSTVAQLFEVVYNSSLLKKGASLLSIISLFMIFIGQIIASKKFMLSLGVSSELVFIAFWLIVIFYTVWGGLKAVVATDIVQALYFIVIFFLCFCTVWFSGAALKANGQHVFELSEQKMIGWLVLPLLFMVIEQDMAQRCFAAKSAKTVTFAALAAGLITMAICMIPVYMGVAAARLGIKPAAGSSILMAAIEQLTSPYMAAFVGAAILAAIISTADSLINAVSSNISQDFLPHETSIRGPQMTTALLGVGGLLASYYFNNIVDILIQSYELSVSCLFVPVAAALFKRKGRYLSALLAMSFGFVSFFLLRMITIGYPRELISILLSGIGFTLGELIICGSWHQKSES